MYMVTVDAYICYLHNCYRWQSLTCLQSEASKSLALQKEKSRTKNQQLVDFLRNTARWRSTQSWLETSEMLSIQVILSCPCVGWVEPLLNFDTKRDFWDLADSPSNPPTNPMNESMIKTMTIIMTTSKVRNLNVRAASFFYSPVFCDTGRTKSVDWRKEQLRAVDRFETQFSQLSASWTNQDAGWEWGRLHLSVEDRPEQTTPGDNHGRNRLPEVVSFNPKKTFSVNIYISDAPHARNDIIGLLREIDDWTQDTWGPIFNLFLSFYPFPSNSEIPPRYVPKSPLTLLDTVLTHPEPYGVVLVIGDIP